MTTSSVRKHPALAVFGLLALSSELSADSTVCVIAWADEACMQRRAAVDPPRIETYVVMQGRRFESHTRDNSLGNRSFMDIARTIAAQLVRARYEPAPDVGSPDLLLPVHWGTTRPFVSLDSLRGTVTPDLKAVNPHAPTGNVQIGDLQVIGVVK